MSEVLVRPKEFGEGLEIVSLIPAEKQRVIKKKQRPATEEEIQMGIVYLNLWQEMAERLKSGEDLDYLDRQSLIQCFHGLYLGVKQELLEQGRFPSIRRSGVMGDDVGDPWSDI